MFSSWGSSWNGSWGDSWGVAPGYGIPKSGFILNMGRMMGRGTMILPFLLGFFQ